MRININLASLPYEDVGRFYRRWLLALLVVTVLSVGLVYTAMSHWRTAHAANQHVRELKQTLARLDADQKADEAILGRPENHDVRMRSEFLNDAIRRKAFSWTQVFSEFERIMPSGLHVVSIKPELTADNQLAIRMLVAGDARDRGLELMRRMEQSKSFRQTALVNEAAAREVPGGAPVQGGAADAIQFEISALYTPAAAMPVGKASTQRTQARVTAPQGGRR